MIKLLMNEPPAMSANPFARIDIREMKFVESLHSFPRNYQPTRAAKIARFPDYLKVTRYLIPKDPSAATAVLWLTDWIPGIFWSILKTPVK